MVINKLKRKEFYLIYAISLILPYANKKEKRFLSNLVTPIAKKYIKLTHIAAAGECCHAPTGGGEDNCIAINASIVKGLDLNIDLLEKEDYNYLMAKIKLETAVYLFDKCEWNSSYGGKKWKDIAESGLFLQKLLPITPENLGLTICAIDRLNALEHNNDLYLESFSSFNLTSALNHKRSTTPQEIFKYCDKELVWYFKTMLRRQREKRRILALQAK